MSEFDQLVSQLTPDIYQRLKTGVELGKWPDGRKLTEQQRETSLQAVITYEVRNNMPEEQRTGYIEGSCGSTKGSDISVSNDVAYRVGK